MTLRIATYNIHAGQSSSLFTVVEELRRIDADIIALQEVDRFALRSGLRDQAQAIADALQMNVIFAATRDEGRGHFGVAVLSRFSFQEVGRIDAPLWGSFEPRTAIRATVCTPGGPVDVINLHADVFPWTSAQQVNSLLDELRRLGSKRLVILGDFNAGPEDAAAQSLRQAGFINAFGDGPGPATFRSVFGDRRIDHIFISPQLAVRPATVGRVMSRASDHALIWADIDTAPE